MTANCNLGEEAGVASAFADEYFAVVCERAYEGWGFGSHTADKIRELPGFVCLCVTFYTN